MDPSSGKSVGASIATVNVTVHCSRNIYDLKGDKVTAPTYVKLLFGGNQVWSDTSYCNLYNFDSKLNFRGDESHLILEVVYAPGPFGVYRGTVGTCYVPTEFLAKCVGKPFHGSLPLSDPLGGLNNVRKMDLVVTISAEPRTTQMISEFVDEANRTCMQVRISPLKLELNTFPEKAPGCCDWSTNAPLGVRASSLNPYVLIHCGVQSAKTPTAYTVAPKKDATMFLFPPKRDLSTLDRCCCCTCCMYPPYERKKIKHHEERVPGYRKEINDENNHMMVYYENVTKNMWYLHANFLEILVVNNNFVTKDHELCEGLIDFKTVFQEVYFGEKIIKNEEIEVDVPLFVEGQKDAVGKLTMNLELLHDGLAKGDQSSRLLWELSEGAIAAREHVTHTHRMVNKTLAGGPADAHRANDDVKMILARILTASAIHVLRWTTEHESDVNPFRRERLVRFVEQILRLFSPPDEIMEELDEAVQSLIPPMSYEQCRKVFIEVEPSEETRLREFSGVIVYFINEGMDAFIQRVLTVATNVVCSESKYVSHSVFSMLELNVGNWVGETELNRNLITDLDMSFKRIERVQTMASSEGIINAHQKNKEEAAAKDARACCAGLLGENEMPTPPFYDRQIALSAGVVSIACALVAAGFGLLTALGLAKMLLYADSHFFCHADWQKFIPAFKGMCKAMRSSLADEKIGNFLESPVGLISAGILFGVPEGMDSWTKTHHRWAALQEFAWEPLSQPRHSVHKWICVSGFLKRRSDIFYPWRSEDIPWTKDDIYCVRFSTECLLTLGAQLDKTAIRAKRAWFALRGTVAITNPISMGQLLVQELLIKSIDIPLVCAEKQATLAGPRLAQRIAEGPPGVSLVAYGAGCHMIMACLHELRRRDKYFFVKDVILMGGSFESEDLAPWQRAREVVSGNFINAYCPGDNFLLDQRWWIPGRKKMAGIHGAFVAGIENINLSSVVSRHDDYPSVVPAALQYVLAVRKP
eukprot:GEMP01005940.1.p1 GENE.GEMP01005940.1~~GEMP01005940.1.p1  ORF type:complete len:983 (+),score=186.70 GEMP01005940.1:280-3228(+)